MYIFTSSFQGFIKHAKGSSIKTYIAAIIQLIQEDKYDSINIKSLLAEYSISDIKDIKDDTLNFLIDYANYILEDGVIFSNEYADFYFLKRIFKINEGDFIKYKEFQVREILKKEFLRIYSDYYVDEKEQLLSIDLQALFGLSYDQFETIKEDEVIIALIQGANPLDLDIAKIPKGFNLHLF